MPNQLLKNLLLVFLIFKGFVLFGQYSFIPYSLQEGLPQSQVFSAFQDSKGYLWFGTQGGGISRFDGDEFENFTSKEGLPSNYIKAIVEDNNGQLWIGSNVGIAYFDGHKFINVLPADSTFIDVNTMLIRSDSSIWIGTERGVFRYKNRLLKKMQLHKRLDNIGVNDFLLDGQGLWIASNSGIYYKNKSIKRYGKKHGLKGILHMSLLKDTHENIWVATYDGGLNIFDRNHQTFSLFKGIPNIQKPLFLYENKDKHIWVGSRDKGIYDYNPIDTTFNMINEHQGLPHNHIRCIISDQWNNTWICTSGGGVAKYLGRFFAHYSRSNGLIGKYIYAMENDNDGNLIFSASNNGLMVYDGFGFSKYQADSNYIDVKSKSILKDRSGNIWIGTEGKGLLKIGIDHQRTVFTTENGLPDNWVNNIIEDRRGNIWISTSNKGIVKIIPKVRTIDPSKNFTTENGTTTNTLLKDTGNLGMGEKRLSNQYNVAQNYSFKIFNRADGLPDMYISTMKQSTDGKIWFGTKLGKVGYFIDDYIAEVFDIEYGIPNQAIRSIAFDIHHNIWLGTAGKGLFKADMKAKDIRFSPSEANETLHSKNVYSLLFDPEGNLWVGSESGVDKLSMNEASVITKTDHFGRNEGFHGIETCQNASLVGLNGVLWFGTMNGLMSHVPGQEINTLDKPIIHFKDISLFYKSISNSPYSEYLLPDGSLDAKLSLPYDANHLSFEFKAINSKDVKKIQYQWKLKGNEKNWSPLSSKNSVDYSNLDAGDYCFEVRALSSNGSYSEIIESCFSIRKPFWLLTWIQVMVALLLLALFMFVFWKWKKNLEAKELERRNQLEMKNNVLQLEQKALQLQMNPHFIFNALNSIQSLIATRENQQARVQISNFATLMRGILSNSRQDKISLSDEIKVLDNYLKMEQFCQKTSFEYYITIDKSIDPDEVDIPPMILQPYVENAVIHGISHLETNGEIRLDFVIQELYSKQKLIVCTISDNGVGRTKANALKQTRKPSHQSIAMEVTESRLLALKGDEEYTALTIEDILDKEKSIKGTKVIVKLPFETSY